MHTDEEDMALRYFCYKGPVPLDLAGGVVKSEGLELGGNFSVLLRRYNHFSLKLITFNGIKPRKRNASE